MNGSREADSYLMSGRGQSDPEKFDVYKCVARLRTLSVQILADRRGDMRAVELACLFLRLDAKLKGPSALPLEWLLGDPPIEFE